MTRMMKATVSPASHDDAPVGSGVATIRAVTATTGGDMARRNPLKQTLVRFRIAANGSIVTNASSMLGATIATSGFGVVYWLLAARLFPHTAVGFAGASISAMTLLGNAGMLGLGTLLIGELPREPGQEKQLITTAVAAAGIAGALLGVLFALAVPFVSPNLRPLAGGFVSVGLFALGVAFTSVTAVLDQALIGLLRGGLQFGRNVAFAATKLGALLVAGLWLLHERGPADTQWLVIYATWLFGNLVSLAGLAAFVAFRGTRWNFPRFGSRRYLLHRFGLKALGHHWLNLALQVPGFALPVIVTAVLSPAANAYFYVASMISSLVFFGPLALVTALYAVGARDPGALAHRMRFTLGLAFVAGVLVNGALFIGADHVLGLFGAIYAEKAGWTLRILGLGVFPMIVKDHYVTVNRIRGRMAGTALLSTAGGVLELTMAAIGGIVIAGLPGFALGWLAALCIEALCMAPVVYRAAFHVTGHAPESLDAPPLVGFGPQQFDEKMS